MSKMIQSARLLVLYLLLVALDNRRILCSPLNHVGHAVNIEQKFQQDARIVPRVKRYLLDEGEDVISTDEDLFLNSETYETASSSTEDPSSTETFLFASNMKLVDETFSTKSNPLLTTAVPTHETIDETNTNGK